MDVVTLEEARAGHMDTTIRKPSSTMVVQEKGKGGGGGGLKLTLASCAYIGRVFLLTDLAEQWLKQGRQVGQLLLCINFFLAKQLPHRFKCIQPAHQHNHHTIHVPRCQCVRPQSAAVHDMSKMHVHPYTCTSFEQRRGVAQSFRSNSWKG